MLKLGLLREGGRTVAPLNALSRWLCCLASCSSVSSRRILCSLSVCKAFCQRLLWLWAMDRKSLQACRKKTPSCQEEKLISSLSSSKRTKPYIDHGVGGDSEKRGPFCDLSDLFPHVRSNLEPLQL